MYTEILEDSVKVDKDGAYKNVLLRPMELELIHIIILSNKCEQS